MTGEIFIPSVGRRMPTEVEGPFIPSPSTLLGTAVGGRTPTEAEGDRG
ncbi:MAG TPA: hypothetical protein VKB87_22555 [Myxococcaceae bacterium]|nr:hypothetical protein [Myxococcaceae bacterium]